MISLNLFTNFACVYKSSSLLGFPTWYKYLPSVTDNNGACVPSFTSLNDAWLVVAAIIEILLRVASIAAVVMVIYGGFLYLISQGEPDKTAKAKNTLINALVGLAISVMAATIVSWLVRILT